MPAAKTHRQATPVMVAAWMPRLRVARVTKRKAGNTPFPASFTVRALESGRVNPTS